ncbi:MAG: DegT/DnrJ/EryC1/StrS family aminotransferase [Candidatus Omnitrophica bacterium]|nr:DegT/DnrJ/EryC1/StrS family aminotransferase [Candidatus Omnitrophota bacterium]
MQNPLFVTKSFLPPLEEFEPYLQDIWASKWLTNNGKFHQEFEAALCQYLGVKHICLFSNGTLALLTALQALEISGEVITTPFSFVATTHALWWNNIKPVFVDIEPETFCLDPMKIEAAISPKTTAILPVHVYGTPCDVKRIKAIADLHKLKVIYDACHAFGVKRGGQTVLNFGDLSVMSFHATKVFNTFEGGAIVCHDKSMKKRIDFLKNFGFANETTVVGPGINAKMNEFQAALGVLQLKYVEDIIKKRKILACAYRENLRTIDGIRLLQVPENTESNYGYFPIVVDQGIFGRSRDYVYEKLKKHNIISRRYFYPLISQFPPYKELKSARKGLLPVAEKVSQEILCLPLYPDLSIDEVDCVCECIRLIKGR